MYNGYIKKSCVYKWGEKKNIILVYLTVIPLAWMGSESIAHEATRVNFSVYCTSVNFKCSYFYRLWQQYIAMLVTCQSLIKLTSRFISVLSMLLIFIFFHNSLILWECIFFICLILTPKINSVTNDIHILPAGMSTVYCWQDFYQVYVPPLKLFIIQIHPTSLNNVKKSCIGSKIWFPFNILSFNRVDLTSRLCWCLW